MFGVPFSTLRDHYKDKNKFANGSNVHIGRPTILRKHIEDKLVKYILERETARFGLTRTSVCELAYELAEKHRIEHNFNHQKKRVGDKWFKPIY